MNEVPEKESDKYCSADGESDEDFLPGEVFPVGLEVEDEPGDCNSESAEHDKEENGFPDDSINDFLPGMGGDESVSVAVDGPGDDGHPEGSEDSSDVDCGGDVSVLAGCFGAVGLEWHLGFCFWTKNLTSGLRT